MIDGPFDDINVSYANLFVNLLDNQQETMNENIVLLGNRIKTCSDDRKGFDNLILKVIDDLKKLTRLCMQMRFILHLIFLQESGY